MAPSPDKSLAKLDSTRKTRLSPILSKLELDKNTGVKIKPPVQQNKRTPMGEFVSREAGDVLTQLAVPLPGAADYYPDISKTKRGAPQYSIAGRPKDLKKTNGTPAPNQYRTEKDMVWKKRRFPLPGKENLKDHRSWLLGPASYLPKGKEIGHAPKWSISSRTSVISGPPSLGVHPVDSQGFKTPAANHYRPKACSTSTKITMGLPLKPKYPSGPGPAEYDYQHVTNGPAFTMAKRFPKFEPKDTSPGPASYDIDTTIGKSVSKSILKQYNEYIGSWTPGPNVYNLSTYYREGPKYSLGFHRFQRKMSPTPHAASYTPKESNQTKQPVFSFNSKTLPAYPDILYYPDHSLMKNENVGPGSYFSGDINNRKMKSDTPAYSIGKKLGPPVHNTPGPASYNVRENKKEGGVAMGGRSKTKETSFGPGPAAYYPKLKSHTLGYSMTARNGKKTTTKTPAPNSYQIQAGLTSRGMANGPKFSFKGRPSPFVYSGFNTIPLH